MKFHCPDRWPQAIQSWQRVQESLATPMLKYCLSEGWHTQTVNKHPDKRGCKRASLCTSVSGHSRCTVLAWLAAKTEWSLELSFLCQTSAQAHRGHKS